MIDSRRLAGLWLRSATALVLPAWLGIQAAALNGAGTEYRFLPSIMGDQVNAQLSLNSDGGYLVLQDNSIDGNGLGIRARRINADFSAAPSTFQVNLEGAGDQQNPRVAVFSGGGAVFAWQGSTASGNRIFLRFMNEGGTFVGVDRPASDIVNGHQSDPALAVLTGGTVVVAWAEWNRDGDMRGIFAQRFARDGARVGTTFQVNQRGLLDQRTPALAALSDGGFVAAWVSDEQRHENSIDIYARIYNAQAQPLESEFRLNSSDKICANPELAAIPGGFRAAWSARALLTRAEGWDVETRVFDSSGKPAGAEVVVNATTRGDQFAPRIASFGSGQLIVWTSFGQDGADEGVYGRVVSSEGFDGSEFRVNTRTRSRQILPAAASLGDQTVVVVWSSFVGGPASFDLFAQNYSVSGGSALPQAPAPFVASLSQNAISVSWPEVLSGPVTYLVYVDDEPSAAETISGMMTLTRAQWQPGSTHTVRMAYRAQDGRVSPVSDPVQVKTWGADVNGDGLPDDWQTINWGKLRPPPEADSDQDGASNLAEFLAGTDPTDPNSVLRLAISPREQGHYIEWSTEAGNYYQLQVTSDFKTWRNAGAPRFAASMSDSMPISNTPAQVQYYRVIRLR